VYLFNGMTGDWPTVENVAAHLAAVIEPQLPVPLYVESVTIQETAVNAATWTRNV